MKERNNNYLFKILLFFINNFTNNKYISFMQYCVFKFW